MNLTKTVLPITAVYIFRMLGLFMLIPVFTLYAYQLQDATSAKIGFALGAYGLSQSILQIPFGLLSDRFGRKKLLYIGLVMLFLGSLLGAHTASIYGMIIARSLQGAGAIGSVLLALLADLTTEKARTKAMAIIGIGIGLSFGLAILISPPLTQYAGSLSIIFELTAALSLLGLLLVYKVIPNPQHTTFHPETEAQSSLMLLALSDIQLWRFNLSIFFQHSIFTATFFVLPLLLKEYMMKEYLTASYQFYVPVMLCAFFSMLPLIRWSEKTQRTKMIFLTCVLCISACQLLFLYAHSVWMLFCFTAIVYLVAFNFLEANIPSLISKYVNPKMRGTALGIYSSAQFLGIFAGGLAAGTLFNQYHSAGIFYFNGISALLWFFVSRKIPFPTKAPAHHQPT